ncbi:MAG TPA: hypothetical protein VIL50_07430 [Candidatus Limnocylindrales bacterium]
MTTHQEPGERRPKLDRPPGDRYLPSAAARERAGGLRAQAGAPLAVAGGGVLAFVILGGILAITAGLIVLAGLIGWLTGLVVRPPLRAAAIAVAVVLAGLLGIWLFGRWEGGVLDPIEYFAEVQGILVPLELLAAGGLAAAASR